MTVGKVCELWILINTHLSLIYAEKNIKVTVSYLSVIWLNRKIRTCVSLYELHKSIDSSDYILSPFLLHLSVLARLSLQSFFSPASSLKESIVRFFRSHMTIIVLQTNVSVLRQWELKNLDIKRFWLITGPWEPSKRGVIAYNLIMYNQRKTR